jgi:NADP-dependent aldehyde dehydrogenase
MYRDATPEQIKDLAQLAAQAFPAYRNRSLDERRDFLYAIAHQLRDNSAVLIATAMKETHLPEARLRNELGRTILQLQSYADAARSGACFEATLDAPDAGRNPPKPDLRKLLVPLGPVAVFGAANFPFAYSTAGGDTASALAAGCPVLVKAHPAHPHTSEQVAELIRKAARETQMPEGVFGHLHGVSNAVGLALAEDPLVKAIGFTGSRTGGRQLFDRAQQRPEPIPVFAEMSSINPVFLLPEKLTKEAAAIASMYAASITLGVGQFCTNPGLLVAIESEALRVFVHDLGKLIQQTAPGDMLHTGIADNYARLREETLMQEEVHLVAEPDHPPRPGQGLPGIATVSAAAFLQNPLLHREVFGPFSILVSCRDRQEMEAVARALEGQLTCTLMATEAELSSYSNLTDIIRERCGRLVWNGVPTGVEVTLAMQHGGPWPASTDSRFGAVGPDAIRRFLRPLAYQQWPDTALPPALQLHNPLGIWRRVNGEWTSKAGW